MEVDSSSEEADFEIIREDPHTHVLVERLPVPTLCWSPQRILLPLGLTYIRWTDSANCLARCRISEARCLRLRFWDAENVCLYDFISGNHQGVMLSTEQPGAQSACPPRQHPRTVRCSQCQYYYYYYYYYYY